ncbi:probable phytase [[Actinomadura] parvosata subsp. kistnae]|uniref:Hydrolase n=1 Tax=[Actinomadura] parvosata subsp. kistnae TaxID=1909395 RepID=A0A1U9ZV82_9ACTN|nr:phytase [Nonomuraea sp. ATCC 55076]AQZ61861.1 hydrolase [Nonomuraea sp. ATCC 55076]SPL88005.1 probable phytase [Actinomadura parvosata subsp. kistnae]
MRRPHPVLLTALATLLMGGLTAPTAASANTVASVDPQVETPALFDDEAGGNANGDDPAIWVDPDDDEDSVIVTTAKEGGLNVYDLDGQQLQHFDAPAAPGPDDENGRFNNVDTTYGFAGKDLAVVSDRGRDQLRFYAIRDGHLTDVTDPAVPFLFNTTQAQVNDQETGYGLTTWKDATGTYALVSRRHKTSIGLFKLVATAGGKVGYQKVRALDLPASFTLPNGTTWAPCMEPDELAQVEGMVVDQQRDVLYAAQEDVGIWRVRADLTGTPVLVDKVKEYGVPGTYDPATEECTPGADPGYGGTHLSADAEGLTIYYRENGKGYLLASSQGDNTFAVYRREPGNAYVGQFRVADGNGLDGVEHSDGSAVINVPLGDFDHGMFIAHDGANTPEVPDRENTNFKFVDWDDIADDLDLAVDTDGWNPRD